MAQRIPESCVGLTGVDLISGLGREMRANVFSWLRSRGMVAETGV
jgi:hypothetical protein